MYIIDTQFGKINFVSGETSPTIAVRTDRDDATFVIEIGQWNTTGFQGIETSMEI